MGIEGHNEILHYAQCLAYLPAHRIEEGFTAMKDDVLRVSGQAEKLRLFVRYIDKTWVPLKEIISVYQRYITTNNLCERYHRDANAAIGEHPEIYLMLG